MLEVNLGEQRVFINYTSRVLITNEKLSLNVFGNFPTKSTIYSWTSVIWPDASLNLMYGM